MSNMDDIQPFVAFSLSHSDMRHDVCCWSVQCCVIPPLHWCVHMCSAHPDHLACEDGLYHSLRVAMEDPACAVNLDPSRVHCSQDSPLDPLSWIDETGEPCSMVFPAVFDLYGGHTALEPYFTLLDDCTDLVCLSFHQPRLMFLGFAGTFCESSGKDSRGLSIVAIVRSRVACQHSSICS